MKIKLYDIRDNSIIINNINTWPNEWRKFLNDNYKIIRMYRYYETKNFNLHEKAKNQKPINFDLLYPKNLYYDAYNDLKNQFQQIVYESGYNILCFHASRYCGHEINDIKINGLKTSSLENVNYRFNKLLEEKIITKEDYGFVEKINLLHTDTNRAKQIWFTTGNVDIRNVHHNGLYNLYNNFGGEIVYFTTKENDLAMKLKSESKACIVVVKIDPKEIVWYGFSLLIDNIMRHYLRHNTKNIEAEFYINSKFKHVIDIYQVDEKTRFDFY